MPGKSRNKPTPPLRSPSQPPPARRPAPSPRPSALARLPPPPPPAPPAAAAPELKAEQKSANAADAKAGANPMADAVRAVNRTPPPNRAAARVPSSDPSANRRPRLGGGVLLSGLENALAGEDGHNPPPVDDGVDFDEEAAADALGADEPDSEESGKSDEKGGFVLTKTRIAPFVIESVRNSGQTFTAYAENKRMNARNFKEVIAWAQAIDSYLHSEPQLPLNAEVLELMVRRFVGVIEADRRRNWTIADALALRPTSGTTLPRQLELQLLMDANKLERAQKYANKVAAPAYRPNTNYGPGTGPRMFGARTYSGTSVGNVAASAAPSQKSRWTGQWAGSRVQGAGKPQRGAGAGF